MFLGGRLQVFPSFPDEEREWKGSIFPKVTEVMEL